MHVRSRRSLITVVCCEHGLHTTRPQRRQWWRRLNIENCVSLQHIQTATSSSDIHNFLVGIANGTVNSFGCGIDGGAAVVFVVCSFVLVLFENDDDK